MPNELLQTLLVALFGVMLSYLINQLPPLRSFQGSRFLLISLVVEFVLLGGIWTWISGENAKTSNVKGLVEKIFDLLLGISLFHLIQIILGNFRSKKPLKSIRSKPNSSYKTVVKGTDMIGKGNKVKVNRGDTWVEDTKIEGENQEFSVTNDSSPQQSYPQINPQTSSQNNAPNP